MEKRTLDSIYKRRAERIKELEENPDAFHTKCTRCNKTKSLTKNIYCTTCAAFLKNKTYSQCSKCGAAKKANKSHYCNPCNNLRSKPVSEERKEKTKLLNENRKIYGNEIIDFVSALIKRHHLASEAELYKVMDYHQLIYDYSNRYENLTGMEQICLYYRDLCLFYKKNQKRKKYVPKS